MDLTERQKHIINIVKENEPISADMIASHLELSKSTLRSDLAVLSMIGILEARPKVGYIYSGLNFNPLMHDELYNASVESIMKSPLIVTQDMTIQDAVTHLFMYDSGSLYVTDDKSELVGVVSRKDLLRFLLNGSQSDETPIAVVMTRMPNILVVYPDSTVIAAARLLQLHEIDSLPVVENDHSNKVIGKISKTSIISHYLNFDTGGSIL